MKHQLKQRNFRRRRIRAKIAGKAQRPRLSVFRSLSHIYAQIIDDATGKTLVAASDLGGVESSSEGSKNLQLAKAVGLNLAKKAQAVGIKEVVFDRGGYKYHGRIKALADGARSGGLIF